MAWLKKRNNIYHVFYYDASKGKHTTFTTKTSDKKKATKIKQEFERNNATKFIYPNINDSTKIFSSGYLDFKIMKQKQDVSRFTLEGYDLAVEHFLNALPDKDVNEYTSNDFDKLIDYFNSVPLSKKSQSNYSSSLRTIFSFFQTKQWTNFNPISKVKKDKKKLVKAIPQEHLQAMLNHLLEKGMIKQYNFVYLSYLCAFRISECIFTEYSDHDIDNNLHYIRNSKGKRIDTIPMLKDTKEFLLSLTWGTGRIFNYSSRHSARSFWKTLNKDLHFNYAPHQLRKSRGTQLANNGAKLLFLMEYMRHRDISTTKDYYIEVSQNKMRDDLNNAIVLQPNSIANSSFLFDFII